MTPNQPRAVEFVRLIGAFKLLTAVIGLAAVFGLFRLFEGNVASSLEHFVKHLHLDPENRLIHAAIDRISGLKPGQVHLIEVGTLFYATLHTVEGIGLLLGKRWGALLTILATGSLLPLECYDIHRRPAGLRIAVLALNIAIVIYLFLNRRKLARVHILHHDAARNVTARPEAP